MARRHRRSVVAVAASALILGLVVTAVAAPEKKSVVVDVTVNGVLNPSVAAGVNNTFDVTVYNTSDNTPLGAADIPLPEADFEVGSVAVEGNWTATVIDGKVRIVANDSQSRVPACGSHTDYTSCPSITVSIGLTIVQPPSTGTPYAFGAVDARQANNFNGALNELNFDADRSHLGFTATGEGKRCATNPCTSTIPREGSTSLKVSVPCVGNCGILGADIDASYLDAAFCAESGCLGEGIFWNPPADAGGKVTVEMTLNKSVHNGSPNAIDFYVIFDGDGKPDGPVLCGTAGSGCVFTVSKVAGGHFLVTATVDPDDPRGFAS